MVEGGALVGHEIVGPGSTTAEVEAEIGAVLRARGERMTGPRRAVIRALAARPGHSTADEVVQALSTEEPPVHRASVYRTLEALSDCGVVQHVHLGHGGAAYHLLRARSPHLHASCRRCGAVRDLPATLLDAVAEVVATEHDFALDATHVALSGTCGACRRAAEG